MGNKRDYYGILGVAKNAGEEQIKAAYRKLVKQYHPDANPDNPEAEEKIKEINEAFEILSDPQKKAEYDAPAMHGGAQQSGGPFSGGFGGSPDINFADFFSGSYGDIFNASSRNRAPNQGRDININVQITPEEARSGTKKEVSFNYSESCAYCNGSGSTSGTAASDCPQCNGTGQEQVITRSGYGKIKQTRVCPLCQGTGKDIKDACPKCCGSGFVKLNKKITVKIPPGIASGQIVSVKGMGAPGEQGSPRGNLQIKVAVRTRKW
jgi:molecular chaperone DnaJ